MELASREPSLDAPRSRATRAIRIGSINIGGGYPIAVQSMAATPTADVEATAAQVRLLAEAGAEVVRVAVDTPRDVEALRQIRRETGANLSVDLQENYRLAADVAPWVDKLRYNPGYLGSPRSKRTWQEKVRFLAAVAGEHDCAIRVGVNCGSIDPTKRGELAPGDNVAPMLESALEHCAELDRLAFTRYCVSLKDSDPAKVVEANRRFAAVRPDVPLHLGVTEAGMPPEGILKTRIAFEQLIPHGIGDTVRVSLTVPAARKAEEITAARAILADIAAGRLLNAEDIATFSRGRLNIIACPSCSRVQNAAFVELAEQVREATRYAADYPITIAVMGCRVNGPGETDVADLGLWCGPTAVNLKRGGVHLGAYSYTEILSRLLEELDTLTEEASGTMLDR